MKTIKIDSRTRLIYPHIPRQWLGSFYQSKPNYDTEWTAIQEERKEKNTTLEFFIIDCDCGTSTMIELEYVPYRSIPAPTPDGWADPDGFGVERLQLKCTGCDTKFEYSVSCTPDGVKIRILESWHDSNEQPLGLNSQDLQRKIEELSKTVNDLIREREDLLRLLNNREPSVEEIRMSQPVIRLVPDASPDMSLIHMSTFIDPTDLYGASQARIEEIGDMFKHRIDEFLYKASRAHIKYSKTSISTNLPKKKGQKNETLATLTT